MFLSITCVLLKETLRGSQTFKAQEISWNRYRGLENPLRSPPHPTKIIECDNSSQQYFFCGSAYAVQGGSTY